MVVITQYKMEHRQAGDFRTQQGGARMSGVRGGAQSHRHTEAEAHWQGRNDSDAGHSAIALWIMPQDTPRVAGHGHTI